MGQEPVTFSMFAAAMRLGDDASEQVLIEGFIAAAREWAEDYTGLIVAQREVTDFVEMFGPRLQLSKGPFVGPVNLSYTDEVGATVTYSGAEVWRHGRLAYLHSSAEGWPSRYRKGSIAISYVAGYDPVEVPQRFVQAILLLAAEYYRARSAGSVSADAEGAVVSLLRSFRTYTL